MNYRHAFHAGNFADVVKHAVLARIVLHLLRKDAPFRVIDTHAGAGLYDLSGSEAARSGEWREGIGRLLEAKPAPPVAELLAPYLDAVRSVNSGAKLSVYPGSPLLVRSWLRRQDRLIACEMETKAAVQLSRNLGRDIRVKAIEIDGWTALSAYVPPKERRGLVLIDPPFEEANEFARLAGALIAAHRKWPTGIYLAWYPIKDVRDVTDFVRSFAASEIGKILRAEVTIASAGETDRLRGSGLIVVNPPWTLEGELRVMLPELARILGPDGKGRTTLDWLGTARR